MSKKIKDVEILNIQVEKNNYFIVNAKIDKKMMEFKFQMIYEPELRASSIERSENFIELAKFNSSFEDEVHLLVKKIYHGEKLKFPIKLKFE